MPSNATSFFQKKIPIERVPEMPTLFKSREILIFHFSSLCRVNRPINILGSANVTAQMTQAAVLTCLSYFQAFK